MIYDSEYPFFYAIQCYSLIAFFLYNAEKAVFVVWALPALLATFVYSVAGSGSVPVLMLRTQLAGSGSGSYATETALLALLV